MATICVLFIVVFGVERLGIAVSGVLRREVLDGSLQATLGRHPLGALIFGSLRLVLTIKIGHCIVLIGVKFLLRKIHDLLTVSIHVVIETESMRFPKVGL